ncbi:MAG: hypothetical protein AAFZ80_01895 [Cyanobacteria bacterium P01_A01_bin.105]
MTVEQTTQLIALIFNSMLMVLLSGLLWVAAWYRHQSLSTQLQTLQKSQQILFVNAKPNREPQLQRLRQTQKRLRRQLRLAYSSRMTLHYMLAILLLSVLLLGLRTLLFSNVLISAALLLFTLGAMGVLISVLLLLVDVHQTPTLGRALFAGLQRTVAQLTGHLRSPSRPVSSSVAAFKVAALKVPTPSSLPPLAVPKTGTDV